MKSAGKVTSSSRDDKEGQRAEALLLHTQTGVTTSLPKEMKFNPIIDTDFFFNVVVTDNFGSNSRHKTVCQTELTPIK